MDDNGQRLWRDKATLERLYWEEGNTIKEVADELGCSSSTVRRWLNKYDLSKPESATYITNTKGYEHWMAWNGETIDHCKVHRLAAVAWFGLETVADKDVHHVTDIPWDNREPVLEVMEPGEHARHHRLAETPEQSKRRVRGVQ